MHEAENTRIIQDAYAAFGRGDIAGVLAHIADDVVWHGVYGAGPQVPTSGERHGKTAVAEFFGLVAAHMKFSTFEPKEFIATGDKVVTLGHYTGTSSMNKQMDSDFAMVFTLRNGKVTRFQEFCNSAAVNAAYGVPAGV